MTPDQPHPGAGEVKPYRPASGFEGAFFMERFCENCTKDNIDPFTGAGEGCSIIGDTMIMDADDPDYPPEWVQDEQGPRCTAFSLKPEAVSS